MEHNKDFLEIFETALKGIEEQKRGVVSIAAPKKLMLEARMRELSEKLIKRDIDPLTEELYKIGNELLTKLEYDDKLRLRRMVELAHESTSKIGEMQFSIGIAVGWAYAKEFSIEEFIDSLRDESSP
jgi:tRNA A37 N6-isopentenylltransferase MiaA